MRRRCVLLVEDDPKDVELTLAALERDHLANRVVVARDGVEALDYLYRRGAFAERVPGHPILILLDLKLPKMDGLEVLRRIKSDRGLASIPTVILTSSREERDVAEGYRSGVNAYVVKPVEFHKLTTAVRRLGLFWLMVNEPPPTAGR